MANNLTSNPWVIDTAATITTMKVRVATIRWIGATDAAHTAVITDTAGHVVWAGNANAADYSEESHPAGYARHGFDTNGLIVTTLGSGKLYVEFA